MEADWRTGSMDEFLKGFLKGNEFGDDPSTKWINGNTFRKVGRTVKTVWNWTGVGLQKT